MNEKKEVLKRTLLLAAVFSLAVVTIAGVKTTGQEGVNVIPLFVGIALIVNGLFVSKKLAEIARQAAQSGSRIPEKETNPLALGSADTTEFIPSGFSVTEETTKHLRSSDYKQ